MFYNNYLGRLRSLFQVACFGLIGLVAVGGNVFNGGSAEIRDTGSVISDHTLVKQLTTPATGFETPTIASNFAGNNQVASTFVQSTPTIQAVSHKTIRFDRPITDVDNSGGHGCTEYDAGTGIMHCTPYGGKFYYAHRHQAFGQLSSANIGDYIVIAGQTYQVQARHQSRLTPQDMTRIVYAKYNNATYDISLMTCAGPGDTERLVVYANRV